MGLGKSSIYFGLAILAVLTAASAVLALITGRSVERVDAHALNGQRKIIQNVMKLKAERFHAVIEEFGEYAPLSGGPKKVQALLDDEGSEMSLEHDVDAILIYDAAGRLSAQYIDDNTAAAITRATTVTGFVERQRASLPSLSPDQPEPVAGAYLVAFGKVYSAGFTAVRFEGGDDEDNDSGARKPQPPALYMLWLSDITQAESDILASDFAFKQLSLTGTHKYEDRPGAVSHLLKDDRGQVVAWFTWEPETYGQEIMAEVRQWGPLVGMLAFVMLSVMGASWAMSMSAVSRTRAEALEANRSNEAKSQFLANMSHELRTPLNAIIGFTEIIREEMFGPVGNKKYRDYIATIHDSGKHLLAMIDQVLNLAKIEARSHTPTIARVSVDEAIASVVAMTEASAISKNLTLRSSAGSGLAVLADETALRQVLINLIGNAIKYTDAGEVAIEAEAQAKGSVVIRVRDTGVGIPPNQLPRLGTPFHQVHDAFLQNRGGVGLGLSITRALLKDMGGSIDIASTVGVGTVVTIRLPLAAHKPAVAAA
jgi:signal transduction histidine kinase